MTVLLLPLRSTRQRCLNDDLRLKFIDGRLEQISLIFSYYAVGPSGRIPPEIACIGETTP